MKKLALTFALLVPIQVVHAADFFCPSGDVTCLIVSINNANQNGEENTINLAPGTYTLTAIDNGPSSSSNNGLPRIASTMIINGDSGETTIIERDLGAPSFRMFDVADSGRLTLHGLTVRGGAGSVAGGILNTGRLALNHSIIERNGGFFISSGGGITNRGILTITHSVLTENKAFSGGGILNSGETTITNSSITGNLSAEGGGIFNVLLATTIIQNSTISENGAQSAGGGLFNDGNVTIINTTIADNGSPSDGGGIANRGMLTITNSTIARNAAGRPFGGIGGGILTSGTVKLQNTILALNFIENSVIFASDCTGLLTSFGNNIIGDPSNCDINLLPSDSTGDPGLGDFVNNGTSGNGHLPLISGSQAIDKAHSQACPETDQLGNSRVGPCDIGAVEFQDGRLLVTIDIRPRSDANKINPSSTNNINVAILSGNGFDARTVDPSTVRFGATGKEATPIHVGRRDVEKDGDRDVVLRFAIQDLGIQCGNTSATLTAQTSTGLAIIGSSPITTTGCRQQ